MPKDYEDMTVPELKEELREHDLKVSGNKSELLERLTAFANTGEVVDDESEGAEIEGTPQTTDAPDTEQAEEEEDMILVRMDRQNHSFTWGGVTFTSRDPFRALPTSKAQVLMDNFRGFNRATPREVEEYYS